VPMGYALALLQPKHVGSQPVAHSRHLPDLLRRRRQGKNKNKKATCFLLNMICFVSIMNFVCGLCKDRTFCISTLFSSTQATGALLMVQVNPVIEPPGVKMGPKKWFAQAQLHRLCNEFLGSGSI
jgi:hypothetical protein